VPLTFAHPAAAVPLRRVLGRAGVLSALVVGSVVPDLPYFVPLPVSRASTHSLPGLLWFCLPVGAASYVVFHRALKQPLCALLPAAWQERLWPLVYGPTPMPAVPWWAVALSILTGALTHLGWDFFTHGTPLPILGVLLFTVSGYPMYVHRALFHASTLIGVALITWWSARWLRRAEPAGGAPPPRLSPALRATILGGLVAAMVLVALPEAEMPSRVTLRAIQRYFVRAGIPGLGAFGMGVLLYCAGWHCLRAVRRPERS